MKQSEILGQLEQVIVGGFDVVVETARNYRRLRTVGVTVRGTVDVLIATRCLADGLSLLHSDRDFDAFEQHLGLCVVDCVAEPAQNDFRYSGTELRMSVG